MSLEQLPATSVITPITARLTTDQKLSATTGTNTNLDPEELTATSSSAVAANVAAQPFNGAPVASSTATSFDPTTALKGFVPAVNVLGNYDQATYYIKFYLVPDLDDNSSSGAEVIIAETGETGFKPR